MSKPYRKNLQYSLLVLVTERLEVRQKRESFMRGWWANKQACSGSRSLFADYEFHQADIFSFM